MTPPGPFGLSIASHSGLPVAAIGGLAAAAEAAGFGAVFVAEGHGDALSLCHPVAAATGHCRIGTAIANAALRPPVLAAKTAAQLDQATNGRFLLGLGVGNAVMNARFGLTPLPPVQMIEEYVAVVRAVLAGDRGYQGALFRTGGVPLDSPPVRPDLPVYLAALGPRMLELAGRIADGVILNLMSPAQAGQAAGLVRAAAVAAGRDPALVEIVCVVHCCVSDDDAEAAQAAREVVPRYVLHPATPRLFGELDGDVLLILVAGSLALPGVQATLRATNGNGNVYATSGLIRTPAGPVGPRQRAAADQCGDGEVRCFSPALYAVDTVVPLISLDQRAAWYPDPHVRFGNLVLWWLNLATLLGWLLSSVLVLSLARLSRTG